MKAKIIIPYGITSDDDIIHIQTQNDEDMTEYIQLNFNQLIQLKEKINEALKMNHKIIETNKWIKRTKDMIEADDLFHNEINEWRGSEVKHKHYRSLLSQLENRRDALVESLKNM